MNRWAIVNCPYGTERLDSNSLKSATKFREEPILLSRRVKESGNLEKLSCGFLEKSSDIGSFTLSLFYFSSGAVYAERALPGGSSNWV